MQTEFFNLSLSRQQAIECLNALLIKAVLEDELRSQRGQEPVDPSILIDSLATLLNVREQALETQMDTAEESLWEYSWFAFTNEWAWFRAKQEVLKNAIGNISGGKDSDFDKRVEKVYKQKFDVFVSELDMQSQKNHKMKNIEQRKSAGKY